MRSWLIALVAGVSAVTMAVPDAAEAHWRHSHHVWHRGPSYYPIYGFNDDGPYDGPYGGPVCVWHREWDAYWHRDCL